MFARKIAILVGLVFAVVVLNPASVAAQPGIAAAVPVSPLPHPQTIEKQDKASLFGIAYLKEEPVGSYTYTLHTEVSGVGTFTGRYTGTTDATAYLLYPPGIIVGSGTVVIVAANGDEVYGNQTFETSNVLGEPPTHTTTIITEVTGGTGKAAGLTGELVSQEVTTTKEVIPPDEKVSTFEGTTTGHLIYPLR
jgi:hypothetical protein